MIPFNDYSGTYSTTTMQVGFKDADNKMTTNERTAFVVDEHSTFFEQAEDAKNALEQAKTEEHAKTEGQTEIKNQAEAETSRAAEDQNTVSLEKGSFIDQVVDDQTAAHEEHQK